MAEETSSSCGRILEADSDLYGVLGRLRRIAVIGIKPEIKADQPAHYVPRYCQEAGMEVIPVPTYFPNITEILGQRVYRSLNEIPAERKPQLVNVFRRPADLEQHEAEIIALAPETVWLQLGISHEAFARRLTDAGIDVVQNRCLLVEHQRLGVSSAPVVRSFPPIGP